MRKARALFLLLVLLLGLPAQANLGALLDWQKRGDSGAYVSSGFHDWRSVSKYRSRPGLHAGYDIAMLAGSAVRTPWPGSVVAITPWYGREMGVTVRLENGWEATFGHITSSVAVGQSLTTGDIVGRVVVDHVDVKIRDRSGEYVDFASREIPSSGAPWSASAAPAPLESPEMDATMAKAFLEYKQLLDALVREEAKLRSGLAARKTVLDLRERLDGLRPLARRHAERSGVRLPSAPSPAQPTVIAKARPVADSLILPCLEEQAGTEPKGFDSE